MDACRRAANGNKVYNFTAGLRFGCDSRDSFNYGMIYG